MNLFKLFFLLAGFFLSNTSFSQNIQLNILTRDTGKVNVNGTVFIEVTVCNTDSKRISVPAFKLRPQISVPADLVSIQDTGHILPAGWTIINNNGNTIRLSNGRDEISPIECRTILIAVQGIAAGGPSSIVGSMNFANGIAPGSESGGPTKGDFPADNSSTTAIKVLK